MNPPYYWLWMLGIGAAGLGLFYLFWRTRKQDTAWPVTRSMAIFEKRRPSLQAAFFQAASQSGKPRGLRWTDCQWSDAIEWVRDRRTGQLLALVGVAISFAAIEGGDMEGVEAVSNLRNASAVFFFHDGDWHTAGHVIFNLNPDEAVEHFKGGYERVSF